MEETKKKSKISEKTKRILNIVFTSLEVVLVLLLLVFSIITIQSSSTTKETKSMFGLSAFTVESNSMSGKIEKGDMVFAKKLNDKEKETLKVGDIVCFWSDMVTGKKDQVVTHEIVKVYYPGENVTIGSTDFGSYSVVSYVTKGCNNPKEDAAPLIYSDVIAKYSFKMSGVGTVISSAKQGNNYFFFIVLPLILIFVWNGYYVVKLAVDSSREKALAEAKAQNTALSEEEKAELLEQAKREILEQLKKEQEEQAKQSENTDTTKE